MRMPVAGVLHTYYKGNTAFEFLNESHDNVVLFIAGLTDGFLTVPYLSQLAEYLAPLKYSLVQLQITSSYIGWGTGSLERDATEIEHAARYFSSLGKKKIVLMGFSTGCQDIMWCNLHKDTNLIDGYVFQASVSDREATEMMFEGRVEELKKMNAQAQELVDQGLGEQVLPLKFSKSFLPAPINAYRWCSLNLPGGDDDFFSSDLSEQQLLKTFGRLAKPSLFCYSECDPFVPGSVNKVQLLKRWQTVTPGWSEFSGLIAEAQHYIKGETPTKDYFARVGSFLNAL